MYVKGVKSVNTMNKGPKAMLKVSKIKHGFYTTLYTQSKDLMVHMPKVLKCTLHTRPLAPPGGKAHCSHQSCVFSHSPV